MATSTIALWLNSSFADFDQGIASAVHQLYVVKGALFTPFFKFMSLLGNHGIFLIAVSLILMIYRPSRRFGTAMLIGLAIGYLLSDCCLKNIIARPRPYTDESSIFYQFWQMAGQHIENNKSFPSGHTTAAFAACVPVFLLGKKKISWLALLFAIFMGLARIYLCVHYPSDVLGGVIVGTFSGVMAVIITNQLPFRWYHKKGSQTQA